MNQKIVSSPAHSDEKQKIVRVPLIVSSPFLHITSSKSDETSWGGYIIIIIFQGLRRHVDLSFLTRSFVYHITRYIKRKKKKNYFPFQSHGCGVLFHTRSSFFLSQEKTTVGNNHAVVLVLFALLHGLVIKRDKQKTKCLFFFLFLGLRVIVSHFYFYFSAFKRHIIGKRRPAV